MIKKITDNRGLMFLLKTVAFFAFMIGLLYLSAILFGGEGGGEELDPPTLF